MFHDQAGRLICLGRLGGFALAEAGWTEENGDSEA